MSTSDDAEFHRLADQLLEAAPPLPPDTLARVQQKLHAELDAGERRYRRRRLAFGWSIAAAILLSLGGYAYFRSSRDAPLLAKGNPPPDPVMIEDRVTIAIGESSAPNTEKALVRLDDYRSLFTD